ncbi:MAG: hypothetical protein RBU37_09235 [Myxococcota bacterium]|jgi:hypothetical protein|nr:hypothetical protein [Myxococcota bacterium]
MQHQSNRFNGAASLTPTWMRQPALIGMLALVVVMIHSAELRAQPNPFEAYEQREGLSPSPAQQCPACPSVRVPAPAPTALNGNAGDWVLSLRSSLDLSYTSSQIQSSQSASNSSMMFRLVPSFGYFLIDDLELALDIGWYGRYLGMDVDELVSEYGWLFEAAARYHWDLSERFGLIGGASFGGYLGSSQWLVTVYPPDLLSNPYDQPEDTSTGGLSGSLSALGQYFLSEHFQLRFGLEGSFLAGLQGSDSVDELRGNASVFLGLSLGGAYFF